MQRPFLLLIILLVGSVHKANCLQKVKVEREEKEPDTITIRLPHVYSSTEETVTDTSPSSSHASLQAVTQPAQERELLCTFLNEHIIDAMPASALRFSQPGYTAGISSDGASYAAIADDACNLTIWSGGYVHDIALRREIQSIIWSPDSKLLAVVTTAALEVFQVAKQCTLISCFRHGQSAPCVAWTPDSKQLVILLDAGYCLWNLEQGKRMRVKGKKPCMLQAPDKTWMVAPDTKQKTLRVWDTDLQTLTLQQIELLETMIQRKSLQLSDDEKNVYATLPRIWQQLLMQAYGGFFLKVKAWFTRTEKLTK